MSKEVIKRSNSKIRKILFNRLPTDPQNVRTLDFSYNFIKDINDDILQYKNLKTLVLRNNKFKEFPRSIFGLAKLECLILGGNEIKRVPNEIYKLSNLKELHLSNCGIEEIPENLLGLKKLKHLWLSGNQIKEIPERLGEMNSLKKIYLNYNHLNSIPKKLIQLKSLEGIFLEGNPLKTIPIYDWKGNKLSELRTYFESIEFDSENVFKAKLLVLGDGAVGKTTLVNRLILDENEFENKKEFIKETKGVNLHVLPEKKVKDNELEYDLEVRIWDFGGQEIQREIHHLFLSSESLYLLLWTTRTIHNKYSYFRKWLSNIESFSGVNSRVILVQTMAREESLSYSNINQEELQSQFPQLLYGFSDISSYENIGIHNKGGLKDLIIRELKELPHVGKVVSPQWIQIEKEIHGRRDNSKILLLQDFKNLCRKHNIDSNEMIILLGWLHNIGSILYFTTPRPLSKYVILDAEWITSQVYQILLDDNKVIEKNHGKFDLGEIADYIHDAEDIVVEIMEKFDFCFPIDERREKFIIPLLLPMNPPEDINTSFSNRERLRYEYEYSIYPQSLISRFISRVYKERLVHKETYWRNGVVLHYKNTFARAFFESKSKSPHDKIVVEVFGDRKWYLLERIQEIFADLNKGAKLKGEYSFCINLSQCREKQLFRFESKTLTKAQEKSVNTIQCLNCFRMLKLNDFYLRDQKKEMFEKDGLKHAIIEGKLEETLEKIKRHLEYQNEDRKNDAIVLLSNLKSLKKGYLNHTIGGEEYESKLSRIKMSTLKIIEEMD